MSDTLLYQEIAQACGALGRCKAEGNAYAEKWDARLDHIEKNFLPSGSGIDSGVTIDRDKSHDNKIVLHFGFHHMNENGFYDGWTDHTAIITPSFSGFSMRITGRDKNGIKEYLHQTFDYDLHAVSVRHCKTCGHNVHVVNPHSNANDCGHSAEAQEAK